jgi:hypothetical protein
MMKFNKKLSLFITGLLILISVSVLADLPPNPGGGPGGGDLPVGGGSPVGGGLLILIFAGLSYGFARFFKSKKRNL